MIKVVIIRKQEHKKKQIINKDKKELDKLSMEVVSKDLVKVFHSFSKVIFRVDNNNFSLEEIHFNFSKIWVSTSLVEDLVINNSNNNNSKEIINNKVKEE